MKRSQGFTMVEAAISVVVLAGLVGAVSTTVNTSFGVWQESNTSARAERQIHRAADRITDHLTHAGRDTILPQAPATSDQITFRKSFGYADGLRQWGPLNRIKWEADPRDPADGKDNDGDGMVDEGAVVLRIRPGEDGEQVIVLVVGVSRYLEGETNNGVDDNGNGLVDEPGLVFEVAPEVVTVRMSVIRNGALGRCARKTVETAVFLRN